MSRKLGAGGLGDGGGKENVGSMLDITYFREIYSIIQLAHVSRVHTI